MQETSRISNEGAPGGPPRSDLRFRREILISAQQLVQRIDEIEDELERYRLKDEPQFNAWYEAGFQDEKREIAALESELNSAVQFHNSMVALSKMRAISLERAFALLREEQAAYLNGTFARRKKIEDDRLRREQFIRADLDREFLERMGLSQIGEEVSSAVVEVTAPALTEMDEEKLKLIYRKLVRRLHPDVQGPQVDATEVRWQKRIWHLSQQARLRGDIALLESIYRVSLLRQMELSELTISDAHEVHAWLTNELARLETESSEARSRPAWRFSLLKDFYEVKRTVLADFAQERRFLETELAEIREQHACLQAASSELRRRRTRSQSARDPLQLSLFEPTDLREFTTK